MKNMMNRPYLGLSCYVCITALAAVSGLSFAAHTVNVAALIAAYGSAGALVLLLFRIRPRFAGIAAGCLGLGCWLLVSLLSVGLGIMSGNSPATVALDDKLICRETVYGFVTSDSGEELDIYRRYLFIDYRLYHQIHSDVDPTVTTPVPAKLSPLVDQCQVKINKTRTTTSISSQQNEP